MLVNTLNDTILLQMYVEMTELFPRPLGSGIEHFALVRKKRQDVDVSAVSDQASMVSCEGASLSSNAELCINQRNCVVQPEADESW